MTDDLDGFASDALEALALAEAEARDLGHARVGTEHLLLGLVAATGSAAAAALDDAGASLGAARHKVAEAVGPGAAGSELPAEPLPLTARAARALGRSRRFAHDRHADEVDGGHVLLGVLDVEGRAGQVLRGLGVDLDRLRSSIDAPTGAAAASDEEPVATAPNATCPSCGTALDGTLAYALLSARNDELGALDAIVFSCGTCGIALGAAPG